MSPAVKAILSEAAADAVRLTLPKLTASCLGIPVNAALLATITTAATLAEVAGITRDDFIQLAKLAFEADRGQKPQPDKDN